MTLVIAVGVVLAPFFLPVLPVETYIAYADALGVGPSTEERKELAELPQHYADRHGWEEIVRTTAEVFESLSPAEQELLHSSVTSPPASLRQVIGTPATSSPSGTAPGPPPPQLSLR